MLAVEFFVSFDEAGAGSFEGPAKGSLGAFTVVFFV